MSIRMRFRHITHNTFMFLSADVLSLAVALLVACAVMASCRDKAGQRPGQPSDATAADKELDEISTLSLSHYSQARAMLAKLRADKHIAEWKKDQAEGNLYFNHADFFTAVRSLKRAYYSDDVQQNDSLQMVLLRHIIHCYEKMQDIGLLTFYVDKLHRLASQHANRHMLCTSMFYDAVKCRYKKEFGQAYALADKAVRGIRQGGDVQETYYYWVSYIVMLQTDRHNAEALKELRALHNYLYGVRDKRRLPINNWSADLDAHYAVLLARLGQKQQAHEHFVKYMASQTPYKYSTKCIEVYLRENGLTRELIRLSKQRENYLRQTGNAGGYDIKSVYNTLYQAYMQVGDMHQANAYLLKYTSLQNAIRASEEKYATQELSINYELHQQRERQQARLNAMKLWGVVTLSLILLAAALIVIRRERHFNAIISRKNKWMAQRIDEMLKADEQHEKALTQPAKPHKKTVEESSDEDEQMFMRIVRTIDDEQLYLRPDLTRDYLLKCCKVSKNRFAALFRNYAGTTFSHYITGKRLEHAIGLMKQNPRFTNHAIATDSGFANDVSFYKAFAERYGLTPSEYRNVMGRNDNNL